MRYVCTRACTDFSGRYWEAGAIAEFAEGARVPTWFTPLDPEPLPVAPAPTGPAVDVPKPAPESPRPSRPKGRK